MVISNPFHAYKNRTINQRIAITGVFLGLTILFHFLEKFMPFGGTFIKINLSLLFILPIFYFAGPFFGISVICIMFGIGFALSTEPTIQRIVSQFILLFATFSTIGFMYLYSFVFSKIENHNKKVLLISISTVISITFLLTFLNAIWFTPMYMWAFGKDSNFKIVNHPFDIPSAIKMYSEFPFYRLAHFGIPNYWGGIFAVYITGNLVKFGVIYALYYPLSKVLRQYLNRSSSF